LAKENTQEEVVNEIANDEEINTSYIEFVDEPEENNLVNEETVENVVEENTVEKEVTYKGKTVTVPKAEVAAVNSAEDSQPTKSGGETISAEQAVTKFENDGQSSGIDVSAHQGKIDWAQVKASGIEFAIIRCGFRGYTAGSIYEDAYFKSNIKGAISNGIMVGIYFYSVALNEEEALQEAAWVVEAIKSYNITYPVVYDFEDFNRGRTAGISSAQATSNAITFLNYVSSKGYTPMMYASKNDISSNFDRSRLSGYKFWLAHYTSATNYTGSYQMWQYTSKGSVPGISGNVDMNVAYFRYGSVAEPKHTHDFTNGSIIKTSDSKSATCTETGIQYRRCKDCSESQKEEIPATGHKFGEYQVTKTPTETTEGEKTRTCANCGKTETIKIDKLTQTAGNTNSNTNNANTNTNVNTSTDTNTNTDTDTSTNTNTGTNNTDENNTSTTETTGNNNQGATQDGGGTENNKPSESDEGTKDGDNNENTLSNV
jgi:GH25 family lysozyme M1 (1,4-beta-N-acetylmuramidase)